MTKYTWTDSLGNTETIMVDGRTVRMVNQHGYRMALSNVAFLTNANGDTQATALVREAALQGLDALRRVTKLDWQKA